MFTGIVQDTAEIKKIEEVEEGKRITADSKIFRQLDEGSSVSLSGVCLTVEDIDGQEADFFLGRETIKKTWFDSIEKGTELNAESPLKPESSMGGHIVQGHVEDNVKLLEVTDTGEGWVLELEKPEELSKYIVKKGFIAVDGISLTVKDVEEESFSIMIIPETWKKTNLSEKSEGEKLNLETDITGRYIEKMIEERDN